MPQQVSLPDGTIIPDFPDNPTPEDIQKLRDIGTKMEANMRASTPLGFAKEAGKTAATAVYDSVTGLPKLGQAGADWIADKIYGLATSPEHAAKVREGVDAQRKEGLQHKFEQAIKPETETGQRLANVGSSIGGSMLYGGLGGASKGMNFISGLLGGAGSELLGKMSNPNGPVEQDDPLMKLAGGLGGGIGGGLTYQIGKGALSSQPLREKIARILMENLDDNDINRAVRNMQKSAQQGVEITAPQAFSKTTNIDKLAELANRPEMTNTRRIMNQQVDQMVAKAEQEVGKLPGHASQPTDLANRSREQATDFLEGFGRKASEVGKQFMPELDVIPQSNMRNLNKDLAAFQQLNPNAPITDEVFGAARQALRNPEWKKERAKRQVAIALAKESGEELPQFGKMPPKYLDNPVQIDTALSETLAGAGKNSLGTDAASAKYNARGQQVRETVKRNLSGEMAPDGTYPNSVQPEMDAKRAAQKAILDERDALLEQPVGTLANMSGKETGASAQQSLLDVFRNKKYFPRGTKPGQGQVAELQQQLAAGAGEEGSSLFQDATKTFFKDAVDNNKVGQGTRNNSEFMSGMLRDLGNPTRGASDPRWRQTKDILLANAVDMGATPEEAAQAAHGVEKLLVLAARTAQRGSNPGVNSGTIMQNASPEALRRIGGVNVMSVLRQPALWMQKRHEHAVLQSIDQWVSTPEGLNAMRELAKAPTYKEMNGVLTQFAQQLSAVKKNQDERTSSEVTPLTSSEQ